MKVKEQVGKKKSVSNKYLITYLYLSLKINHTHSRSQNEKWCLLHIHRFNGEFVP